MKNLYKIAGFLVFSFFLTSCATPPQPVDNSQQKIEPAQIEPHKGRLKPETAVARSLKYNLQPIKKQISNKFLGPEAHQNAFTNLRKLREGQAAGLAVSQKELDFAILFAAVNDNGDPQKIDNVFNQIAAQNITLGTINAHKNALYAHKKIFEIRRKIRQYQKQIATIIKKPSEDNYAYQKKLEETIDFLNGTLINMEQNLKDFRQLVKIETSKLEIEGRRFFDTISLRPQISIADYQQAAFERRDELADFPAISKDVISLKILDQYPDTKTTDDEAYFQQNLSARGDAQASVLLQTVLDYQKAGKTKKQKILPKLNEELHKAVYLQVETAYQLAKKTSSDYKEQQNNIKQIQKAVKKLEKVSHPTQEQRINLLQARMDLLKNELLADQILAEKAMTVSSLRFYDGQIKISPNLLTKSIAEIAKYFSEQLQQDFRKQEEKPYTANNGNSGQENTGWAHKENWLEDLMSKNPTPEISKTTKTKGPQDYSLKTVMQLGAFLDKETAQKEWNILKTNFPELNSYIPEYEQTSAVGIPLFRLLIKSEHGGLQNLCAKLRQSGRECFLRD